MIKIQSPPDEAKRLFVLLTTAMRLLVEAREIIGVSETQDLDKFFSGDRWTK